LWYFLPVKVLATRLDRADELRRSIAEIQDPTPNLVSLLDRLCHHAHIIIITGDSYRLTHRTTRKEP